MISDYKRFQKVISATVLRFTFICNRTARFDICYHSSSGFRPSTRSIAYLYMPSVFYPVHFSQVILYQTLQGEACWIDEESF